MDVGSGGGLPAIPFATLRPDISISMVDTVKKKVLFLRQAILELKLKNAKALHTRVEKLTHEKVDVITSRAFASLRDMTEWTRHLLRDNGCWLAMKGKVPEDEIKELSDDIEVKEIIPLTVPGGDFERHLIVLRFKAN
jgi:16S rRNA (guanine527-N7)-methyltransferase